MPRGADRNRPLRREANRLRRVQSVGQTGRQAARHGTDGRGHRGSEILASCGEALTPAGSRRMKNETERESLSTSLAALVAMAAEANMAAQSVVQNRDANTRSLRAYLTIGLNTVIPQDATTNYHYEVRMNLENVGSTPAYN